MKLISRRLYGIPLLLLFFFITSCVPIKKTTYVRTEMGSEIINEYLSERQTKTVKIRDELYIKIISTDEQTARILSNEASDNRALINLSLITYSVDNNGYIDFPFIGKIKVQGLTLEETKTLLEKELSDYISNMSVVIKFVNNKVTVLGEVNKAGVYDFTQDYISIFDAIALAGGTSQYGYLKKITLIRIIDTKIIYHYLDLSDKKIAESPFFYLNPNDVIIVNAIWLKYFMMNYPTISIMATTVGTTMTVLFFFFIAL